MHVPLSGRRRKAEDKGESPPAGFYDSLKMSDLARHVEVEVPEVAGGRVDVLLRFDDVRFVVEIKRELHDASAEGLPQYIGQSVLYHSTDMRLGLLLVLDLTEKPSGPASLERSIWVDRSRPTPSD
jgi:hypothetical protein